MKTNYYKIIIIRKYEILIFEILIIINQIINFNLLIVFINIYYNLKHWIMR